VAEGYGVPASKVSDREELADALKTAIASDGPNVIEVPVQPGMALA
jgi:thiamine pyrophosphate-dependent acetolactate synthase large subunit-like protein